MRENKEVPPTISDSFENLSYDEGIARIAERIRTADGRAVVEEIDALAAERTAFVPKHQINHPANGIGGTGDAMQNPSQLDLEYEEFE